MRRKILPVLALCLLLSSCAEDRYHSPSNYSYDPNFCKEEGVCPVLIGAGIVGAAILLFHH